jgi:arabinogalactan oligomer / maltooligosaccharide transport system permease protein
MTNPFNPSDGQEIGARLNPAVAGAASTVATAPSGDRPPPSIPERRKRGFIFWFRDTGWRHLIGLVMLVFAAFPLLYVLSASLNPTGTLVGSNVLFRTIDFGNYVELFQLPQQPYAAWFLNTMIIGLTTAVGTVFLGALAAYAFSRMRFTGRRVGLLTLLLVQMFPQLLGVVAIFLLLSGISEIFPQIGIGTQAGLILVYLGGALGVNTYLMYGFFNTVPVSIDEAAKIDGASHARIFFTIILRLVAPILAVVGLLSFIATTSEFVIASVVLTSPQTQTLAVGLYQFISQETSTNWTIFSAGAVLAAIPVMALFLYLQKYIIGGLTAGSVK